MPAPPADSLPGQERKWEPAAGLSHGIVHRAGVECTGSYEAALNRFLRGNSLAVIEVSLPDIGEVPRHGVRVPAFGRS